MVSKLSVLLFIFLNSSLMYGQGNDLLSDLRALQQEMQQPPERQCMSNSELLRLNEVILCQQLLNPTQCSEAIQFVRNHQQMTTEYSEYARVVAGAESVSYSPPLTQQEVEDRLIGYGATLGVAAAPIAVQGVRSISGAMSEAFRNRRIIETTLREALVGGQLNASAVQTLQNAYQNLGQLGDTFQNFRNFPRSISAESIRQGFSRMMSRTSGAGVARGLASRSLMLLFIADTVDVVGRAAGNAIEHLRGCTADTRNRMAHGTGENNQPLTTGGFRCVTERCANHFLGCPNMLNLVSLSLEDQARELGRNDEQSIADCNYMKEYLRLLDQPLGDVTIRSCSSTDTNGGFQVDINGYSEVDLRGSMVNPESAPNFQQRHNLRVQLSENNGLVNSVTVDGQFSGNENLRHFEFQYNQNGDFENLFGTPQNPTPPPDMSHLSSLGVDVSTIPTPREWSGLYDRSSFLPYENSGFFGLVQSHRPHHWWRNQAFIFQGRLGQIYHEVSQCCNPQQGSVCRVRMDVSSPSTEEEVEVDN